MTLRRSLSFDQLLTVRICSTFFNIFFLKYNLVNLNCFVRICSNNSNFQNYRQFPPRKSGICFPDLLCGRSVPAICSVFNVKHKCEKQQPSVFKKWPNGHCLTRRPNGLALNERLNGLVTYKSLTAII